MKANTTVSAKQMFRECFDTPLHCLLTLIMALLFWKAGIPLFKWAVINATWNKEGVEMTGKTGANWGFILENARFVILGFYPREEQWRPLAAIILFAITAAVSLGGKNSFKTLLGVWAGFGMTASLLLYGGYFNLPPVDSSKLSGLPLTLVLSVTGIAISYPMGILLALGRNSRAHFLRVLLRIYIEIFQGVPLISLLFVSSMLFPLFLQEGVGISKLLRAETAIVLSSSAYIAEAVRGGLRAMDKGQYEASKALGLSRYHTLRHVILPQVLPIAMPATINRFITLFKDTSLVIVVALFDLLKTSQTPLANPKWMGCSAEAYIFAATIYFLFCFSMSRVSKRFETNGGCQASCRPFFQNK